MRMMKPVLLVCLLTLSTCAGVEEEGSGDTLMDMEDFDDQEEGSGDFVSPTPDKSSLSDDYYDVQFSKNADYVDDDLEYYDDVYPEDYQDFLENYEDDDQDLDDSVLKIVEEVEEEVVSDVEIKPKPDDPEQSEQIIIETSQILIMVGSAFVSFAIFMLSFFLCKRMIARKQEKKKRIPFTVTPEKRVVKESSIVKDYQKVPTTTKEFLQSNSKYAGEEPAVEAPLVQ